MLPEATAAAIRNIIGHLPGCRQRRNEVKRALEERTFTLEKENAQLRTAIVEREALAAELHAELSQHMQDIQFTAMLVSWLPGWTPVPRHHAFNPSIWYHPSAS